ncbi:MAG: Txe/YoeB family addiction module toxin [Puniceicoccales bacterium]|nr:Txe/YoeB family addiction module toxin [Puniceicoccales bacterium]
MRRTSKFKRQYAIWKKENPFICQVIKELVRDVGRHFGTGIGSPEKLSGATNMWSRRINDKHRLVYRVLKKEDLIELIRCRGHYADNGH